MFFINPLNDEFYKYYFTKAAVEILTTYLS